MSRLVGLALALGIGAAVACSSSDDAGTGSSPVSSNGDGGTATPSGKDPATASTPADAATVSNDATTTGDAPAANCVPKGYAGNEKKIGAYCDDNTACPFQVDPFLICTAGHDPSGNHLFCTTPCSKDSECGTNAYCMHDPGGNGCVPAACGGVPGH